MSNLDNLFSGIFGFGLYPEPPDIVPLRILGLDSMPVSHNQVKAAFRARLLAVHPDVNAYEAVPELQQAADAQAIQRPEVAEVAWARDVLLKKVPPPVTDSNVAKERLAQPSRLLCKKCDGARRDSSGEPFSLVGLHSSANLEDWERRAGYIGRLPQPWDGYCWPCAYDAKRERERERRHQARADRECEVCNEVFTPPRADGRYCTPACRQKAYRQRH